MIPVHLKYQEAPGQTMMRGYSIDIGTRLPNHSHYRVSTDALYIRKTTILGQKIEQART